MSLIEGVGDEVIQFFMLVIVVLVALIAWWSTSIADQPLIRTVLILERRTRHRVAADTAALPPTTNSTLDNNIDTGQLEPTSSDENQQEIDGDAACRICGKETTDISSQPATASSSQSSNNDQTCELLEIGNEIVNERNSSSEFFQTSPVPVSAVEDGNNFAECDSQIDVPSSSSSTNDTNSHLLRSRRLAFFQSRQVTLLDSPITDGPVLASPNLTDSDNIDTTNSTNQEQDPSVVSSNTNDDLPMAGSIRIRLKYLNDDQKLVEGRLHEQLGDFKR
jgi:hypothetical protein